MSFTFQSLTTDEFLSFDKRFYRSLYRIVANKLLLVLGSSLNTFLQARRLNPFATNQKRRLHLVACDERFGDTSVPSPVASGHEVRHSTAFQEGSDLWGVVWKERL